MTQDYLSTEAIILKRNDLNDNDGIITLYTTEKGKLSAVAKGIKKNTSKLRGGLQEFSVSNITMANGKSMPIIINTETKNAHLSIRYDLNKMSYATFCVDFLDKVVPIEEKDGEIYLLLQRALQMIDEGYLWGGSSYVVFRLLEHLGYGGDKKRCIICDKEINNADSYGTYDGIFCEACSINYAGKKVHLSIESNTILQAIREYSFEKIKWIHPSERAQKEIAAYMEMRITNLLDKPLKSYEFLKKVEKRP